MLKGHRLAARSLLLFLSCVVVIFSVIVLLRTSQIQPSEIFRQHVLDPIPESVKSIKADQPKKFGGTRYTLRFHIDRDDLALIIRSKPFERVWNVQYRNGDLHWIWDAKHGGSMIVYHPNGPREPAWFRPDLWENPEAYAFYEVGDQVNVKALEYEVNAYDHEHICALLYNERESEAYFVVSNLR